jgi:site-specific DNA-cytosine methylase
MGDLTGGVGFAGGGGVSIAMQALGIRVTWAVECDEAIAAAYRVNLGDHVIVSMIECVDPRKLERPTIAQFSPSCRNASVANVNGRESAEDRSAAAAICRFCEVLEPPLVMLENVWQYRHYESFKSICTTLTRLGYMVDVHHVNFADWGVPQSRKRLILRAVRNGLVPPLPPPEPHRGWYAAIEDLLPSLPDSKFADWQLARLPADLGRVLIDGRNSRTTGAEPATICCEADPSFCVTATDGAGKHRAYLPDAEPIQGAFGFLAAVQGEASNYFDEGECAPTIAGSRRAAKYRAFLLMTGNTQIERPTGTGILQTAEPSNAVAPNSTQSRAYLVDGQQGGHTGDREPTVREGAEIGLTVGASQDKRPLRAWLEQGRVVSLTPRALARLQTFPDWYVLPTAKKVACQIIGNAMPPLAAEKIIRGLLESL